MACRRARRATSTRSAGPARRASPPRGAARSPGARISRPSARLQLSQRVAFPSMVVAIAGGHGQVALHLERVLSNAGHEPLALIRNQDHEGDVRAAGAEPVLCDMEREDDLSPFVEG